MADAHKWMLGPEGLALFYINAAVRDELNLYQHGWHMTATPDDYDIQTWQPAKSAKRFEPGSNNLLGIHALSASLSLIEELGMKNIEKELNARISYLMDRLAAFGRINLLTPANPAKGLVLLLFKSLALISGKYINGSCKNQVICAPSRRRHPFFTALLYQHAGY